MAHIEIGFREGNFKPILTKFINMKIIRYKQKDINNCNFNFVTAQKVKQFSISYRHKTTILSILIYITKLKGE